MDKINNVRKIIATTQSLELAILLLFYSYKQQQTVIKETNSQKKESKKNTSSTQYMCRTPVRKPLRQYLKPPPPIIYLSCVFYSCVHSNNAIWSKNMNCRKKRILFEQSWKFQHDKYSAQFFLWSNSIKFLSFYNYINVSVCSLAVTQIIMLYALLFICSFDCFFFI